MASTPQVTAEGIDGEHRQAPTRSTSSGRSRASTGAMSSGFPSRRSRRSEGGETTRIDFESSWFGTSPPRVLGLAPRRRARCERTDRVRRRGRLGGPSTLRPTVLLAVARPSSGSGLRPGFSAKKALDACPEGPAHPVGAPRQRHPRCRSTRRSGGHQEGRQAESASAPPTWPMLAGVRDARPDRAEAARPRAPRHRDPAVLARVAPPRDRQHVLGPAQAAPPPR